MKKLFVISLTVIILAGTAVGAYLRMRKAAGPEISTAEIDRGDVVQAVGATGTIEAVRTVDVGTQVSGVVKELYADFNSIVRRGQLVAKIDPATIEAQIQSQEASIEGAQANLARLKITLEDSTNKLRRAGNLYRRKLVTEQDLENADVLVKSTAAQIKAQEAGIRQQRATLNQLQVNLGYTNIYAPIDGIVINRKVDVGQTVVSNNMATSIYQIAEDLTRMQLKATVDESDVSLLRPGQTATFRVDAYGDKEFSGSVWQIRLQPTVIQNVVTYTTIISVPNPDLQLKPGMTANVKIEVARRANVLRVPVAALRFRATSEMFRLLNLPEPADLRKKSSSATGAGSGTPSPTEAASGGAASRSIADRGATTIEALFAPLTFTDTPGRVWIYSADQKAKSLTPISVRTGISDGTYAELIAGPGLDEGRTVVTSVDTGQQPVLQRSPLMPGRQPGHFDGGHGPH